MTKYPKTLWVGFIENDPKYPDKVSKIKKWATDLGRWEPVPYHLHPGNEVKLKRENAMMARMLKRGLIYGLTFGDKWELEHKLPDLFKAKKWGSK